MHLHIIISQYFIRNKVNLILQAPFSPDIAPYDFFLFPRFNLSLREHFFGSMAAIQENTLAGLQAILETDYSNCYEGWKKRCNKCILGRGKYIIGDNKFR